MNKKIYIIATLVICAAAYFIWYCLNNNKIHLNEDSKTSVQISVKNENKKDISEQANDIKSIENKHNNILKNMVGKSDENHIKRADLFNELPASAIPLSAIVEISKLPLNIQKSISKIAENSNIYMIQHTNDKIIVISDFPENIRHGIKFTEISLPNGHQIQTSFGYCDKMKDSENDIWEYSDTTKLPTRHTKYNSEGDMDFVEVWNYNNDNPIKYEMKDSDGKVVSIRKETLTDNTDLRVEHLLYDKDGNTTMSISTTYEGPDIKRFTYYNADKIGESGAIFSDYTDGSKTKEIVYTSDLKVKNTYTSEYEDGNRLDIVKLDSNNTEVEKLVPNDKL